MIRVFVSGPYSSDPEGDTEKALALATELLDLGFAPFVPHLTHYWNKLFPRDYEVWMEQDFTWIDTCQYLYRMADSPGSNREVAYARGRRIPVVESVPDLCDYAFHGYRVMITSSPFRILHLASVRTGKAICLAPCNSSGISNRQWCELEKPDYKVLRCRTCVTNIRL